MNRQLRDQPDDSLVLEEKGHQGSATYARDILHWASVGGDIAQDVARGVIGFIPDGFNAIYDQGFKRFPLFGKLFSFVYVERFLKFCTGISITQFLATVLASLIFKPIGFLFGLCIGSSGLFPKDSQFVYQGSIGRYLYQFSGQTLIGFMGGIVGFYLFSQSDYGQTREILPHHWAQAAGVGTFVGMVWRLLILFTVHSVEVANAASARMNVRRAQKLCDFLKKRAENHAQIFVKAQAEKILLQINGPAASKKIKLFLDSHLQYLLQWPYKKISRHLSYLTDRAMHGDLKALKQLYKLYQGNDKFNSLEKQVDRILNEKEQIKIQDEADTLYDKWQYTQVKS